MKRSTPAATSGARARNLQVILQLAVLAAAALHCAQAAGGQAQQQQQSKSIPKLFSSASGESSRQQPAAQEHTTLVASPSSVGTEPTPSGATQATKLDEQAASPSSRSFALAAPSQQQQQTPAPGAQTTPATKRKARAQSNKWTHFGARLRPPGAPQQQAAPADEQRAGAARATFGAASTPRSALAPASDVHDRQQSAGADQQGAGRDEDDDELDGESLLYKMMQQQNFLLGPVWAQQHKGPTLSGQQAGRAAGGANSALSLSAGSGAPNERELANSRKVIKLLKSYSHIHQVDDSDDQIRGTYVRMSSLQQRPQQQQQQLARNGQHIFVSARPIAGAGQQPARQAAPRQQRPPVSGAEPDYEEPGGQLDAAAQNDGPAHDDEANSQEDFECPNNGIFADVASGCQAYHVCQSGAQVQEKFQCPLGTLFNDIILTCDFAHNVHCGKQAHAQPMQPQPQPRAQRPLAQASQQHSPSARPFWSRPASSQPARRPEAGAASDELYDARAVAAATLAPPPQPPRAREQWPAAPASTPAGSLAPFDAPTPTQPPPAARPDSIQQQIRQRNPAQQQQAAPFIARPHSGPVSQYPAARGTHQQQAARRAPTREQPTTQLAQYPDSASAATPLHSEPASTQPSASASRHDSFELVIDHQVSGGRAPAAPSPPAPASQQGGATTYRQLRVGHQQQAVAAPPPPPPSPPLTPAAHQRRLVPASIPVPSQQQQRARDGPLEQQETSRQQAPATPHKQKRPAAAKQLAIDLTNDKQNAQSVSSEALNDGMLLIVRHSARAAPLQLAGGQQAARQQQQAHNNYRHQSGGQAFALSVEAVNAGSPIDAQLFPNVQRAIAEQQQARYEQAAASQSSAMHAAAQHQLHSPYMQHVARAGSAQPSGPVVSLPLPPMEPPPAPVDHQQHQKAAPVHEPNGRRRQQQQRQQSNGLEAAATAADKQLAVAPAKQQNSDRKQQRTRRSKRIRSSQQQQQGTTQATSGTSTQRARTLPPTPSADAAHSATTDNSVQSLASSAATLPRLTMTTGASTTSTTSGNNSTAKQQDKQHQG